MIDKIVNTAERVSSAAKNEQRSILAPMQSIWLLNLYNELFINTIIKDFTFMQVRRNQCPEAASSCGLQEVHVQ